MDEKLNTKRMIDLLAYGEQATREIMWNIPFYLKVSMYILFGIALLIMLKGLQKKFVFIMADKKLSDLLPPKLQWSKFLKTLLLQGKVPRNASVGRFHGLLFYGFFILWIATDLVAIHYDTPFKVFQGTTYKIISFLADFAGLAILSGLILAFKRRYIDKPQYLSSTRPKQEKFMYAMLANLVLIGFLLEGVRILGTGMPETEKYWSPIGWLVAIFIEYFNFSNSTLALSYRLLWAFHMFVTMVFIASLGNSKFYHIIAAPLSALFTPSKRGAILLPMDFENEEAETFGLGKISDMTPKNRMDLLACVECGRCTVACPANNAGKLLDPKKIITKARDFALSIKDGNDELWSENPIYKSNEIDACTTCGACMEECPLNIEHINIIMEAKRYKVLTLGDIPAAAAEATNKIKVNGNPWGLSQEDRFKWADGMDVPIIEKGKKVDYLYYVGCAGSYDDANQKVVKDTISLLQKAGVSFAVMGKTEKCNGDPIRRFGDEYSFYEIAIENIANINKYTFDKIVTQCPHCLHTIGKEYGKFENGNFETIHHSELLAELLKEGKLRPTKTIDKEVTFHDPCYLGRHHGEYNAPREILKSIPGLKIKEMDSNKDMALCCGMGGGNMWYELPEGDHLAPKRLEHVAQTKAAQLATACSYCLINFNSSKGQVKEIEEIEIEDVATTLAKSIQ